MSTERPYGLIPENVDVWGVEFSAGLDELLADSQRADIEELTANVKALDEASENLLKATTNAAITQGRILLATIVLAVAAITTLGIAAFQAIR